jgi:hypothetical protein
MPYEWLLASSKSIAEMGEYESSLPTWVLAKSVLLVIMGSPLSTMLFFTLVLLATLELATPVPFNTGRPLPERLHDFYHSEDYYDARLRAIDSYNEEVRIISELEITEEEGEVAMYLVGSVRVASVNAVIGGLIREILGEIWQLSQRPSETTSTDAAGIIWWLAELEFWEMRVEHAGAA